MFFQERPEPAKGKITVGYQFGKNPESMAKIYFQTTYEEFNNNTKYIADNCNDGRTETKDLWFHEEFHYRNPIKFILDLDLKLKKLSKREKVRISSLLFKDKKEFMEKIVYGYFVKHLVLYLNEKWSTDLINEDSFLVLEACSSEKMSAHIIMSDPKIDFLHFQDPTELNNCIKNFKKTMQNDVDEKILSYMDLNKYASMRVPFGVKRGESRRLLPYLNHEFYDYRAKGFDVALFERGLVTNVSGERRPIQLPQETPKKFQFARKFKGTDSNGNPNTPKKVIYEELDYSKEYRDVVNSTDFKEGLFKEVCEYHRECGYHHPIRGPVVYSSPMKNGEYKYGYNLSFSIGNAECLLKFTQAPSDEKSTSKKMRTFVLDLRNAKLRVFCHNKQCMANYTLLPKKVDALFEEHGIPLAKVLRIEEFKEGDIEQVNNLEPITIKTKRPLNSDGASESPAKVKRKNPTVGILSLIISKTKIEGLTYYSLDIEGSTTRIQRTHCYDLELVERIEMDFETFLENRYNLEENVLKRWLVYFGDLKFYKMANHFKEGVFEKEETLNFVELIEFALGVSGDLEGFSQQ